MQKACYRAVKYAKSMLQGYSRAKSPVNREQITAKCEQSSARCARAL